MSEPKYRQIEQALLARIAAGEFGPGDAIPHEAQLAADYGVTRPTVSRALSGLVAQGLIERRRRVGSRVAVRGRIAARLSIPLAREEIAASGATYGYRLLARESEAPPADLRALFGLPARAPALRVRALHLADGAPWQLEDRWINLRAAPGATEADFATVSANEWLVRAAPVTRIANVLRAEAADAEAAKALGVAPGAPLFGVERTTWLGPQAVTRVDLLHPGAGYRMALDDGG